MPLAVEFYNVVLWVHITAFFIAFGPTYVYGLFYAMAGKAGPQALIAVGKGVRVWDRTGLTIGGVLVLLSGLYLVGDHPQFDFGTFFVAWGVAAIVFTLGMTHGYFLPKTDEIIELLENDRGEEAIALGQKVGKMGAVMGVVIILTIYVMTAKPFL
jgi:hypothetical protein